MKTTRLMRRDWRKIKMSKHDTHVCIRWFHWSKIPRLYICYWDATIHEQRHAKFKFGKI